MTNANLPCSKGQCPYNEPCCKFGVDLEEDERKELVTLYGFSYVTGNRTAALDKCVFLSVAGFCCLHDTPNYPSVCRKFPLDGYEGDPNLCPAVASQLKETP